MIFFYRTLNGLTPCGGTDEIVIFDFLFYPHTQLPELISVA